MVEGILRGLKILFFFLFFPQEKVPHAEFDKMTNPFPKNILVPQNGINFFREVGQLAWNDCIS
jgi:hypothetical protein